MSIDASSSVLHSFSSSPSDRPPRSAQLLLVDGRLSPAYLLPELALPRFAPDATRSGPRRALAALYAWVLRPSLHLLLRALLTLPPLRAAAGCVYGVLVCNVQPRSRGRLVRAGGGADAAKTAPLRADCRFLSDADGHDMRVLFHAMAAARRLLHGQAHEHGQRQAGGAVPACVEVLPGPLFGHTRTFEWFCAYARLYTTTYFHACGTCAMGAVLDDELRVRGVRGLRVCDASAFPRIPTAPISAACMALGEGLGRILADQGKAAVGKE